MGGERFIGDGPLIMLSLFCYLGAAVFYLTNLYAPSSTASRLGLWFTTGGVFMNLSAWGVRWVNAHDRELAIISQQGGEMPWLWRYIPFANLYDLSIAFRLRRGHHDADYRAPQEHALYRCGVVADCFADSVARRLYRQRIYQPAADSRLVLASDSRRHGVDLLTVSRWSASPPRSSIS